MTLPKRSAVLAFVVCLSATFLVSAQAPQKGGEDESGEYEPVADWPASLHPDWTWGRVGGVWAESPNRVYVFGSGELPRLKEPVLHDARPARQAAAETHRREHMLTVFDKNGKLIESWEQHNHLFKRPHSLKINPYDPERHLWALDADMHQIFEFTQNGKLVRTFGEAGKAISDATHFGGPTDIAFLPNGEFLISDGYINSRVVKYGKDGKFVMEWGKKGKGQGEFTLPHSIAVDARKRVYVADRDNSRIQVFDLNGKFLDMWPNIRFPLSIVVSKDQFLWICDGQSNKFLKYTLDGKLVYSFGTFGGEPGQFWGPHQFSVDSDGNLYAVEVWGGRVQKLRPKRNADPARLIGPAFVLPPNS